jgi:hypothetical protein
MICINIIMKNTRLHAHNSSSDVMLSTPDSDLGGPELRSRCDTLYYFLYCLQILRCHKNTTDILWIFIVKLTVRTGPISFMSYSYDISILHLCRLRTKTQKTHTHTHHEILLGIGLESKENHENLSHNLTFRKPCIAIYSYNKTNEMYQLLKFIFGIELYSARLRMMDRETVRNMQRSIPKINLRN